uniref:SFRICE_014656 n=1 Tax=Spodoptera frugiperda TaxID=7108 RepID=A0A2H1WE85_SPOFR
MRFMDGFPTIDASHTRAAQLPRTATLRRGRQRCTCTLQHLMALYNIHPLFTISIISPIRDTKQSTPDKTRPYAIQGGNGHKLSQAKASCPDKLPRLERGHTMRCGGGAAPERCRCVVLHKISVACHTMLRTCHQDEAGRGECVATSQRHRSVVMRHKETFINRLSNAATAPLRHNNVSSPHCSCAQ